MFLAATDICEHCKNRIYHDDEKVNIDWYNYHVECAEELDIKKRDKRKIYKLIRGE